VYKYAKIKNIPEVSFDTLLRESSVNYGFAFGAANSQMARTGSRPFRQS
jgi:hypothetical protein